MLTNETPAVDGGAVNKAPTATLLLAAWHVCASDEIGVTVALVHIATLVSSFLP